MIQFDAISQPVITPELALGPRGRGCEICIATFSHKIHAHVLERFPCEKIAELRGCNGPKPTTSSKISSMMVSRSGVARSVASSTLSAASTAGRNSERARAGSMYALIRATSA